MAFLFAPLYHPALRYAGPTRSQLGVPTVFNFLGPLANPARARRYVVGVSDPTMAERMALALRDHGAERAWVVYGGYLVLRFGAGWRGRRAAYLVLAGFALVALVRVGFPVSHFS